MPSIFDKLSYDTTIVPEYETAASMNEPDIPQLKYLQVQALAPPAPKKKCDQPQKQQATSNN